MGFEVGYTPWNKGRLVGQKRPFKLNEVEAIRVKLEADGRVEQLAMFNLAIDSKLRASDLVSLKIEDVCIGGRARERGSVIQKKTARPVHFEISQRTQAALHAWIYVASRRSGYIFLSPRCPDRHISTRHYARIVNSWVALAGLEPSLYGTHTLRRTKAAYLYRKTGNLRAVQLLLGHKSIENTVRYLGMDIDDALELSGGTDF